MRWSPCHSGVVGIYWGVGHLFICINGGYIRTLPVESICGDVEKGKHAGMRVGYWIRYTALSSDLCSFTKGHSSCLFDLPML